MNYFPLCANLLGKDVVLVGNGKQIQEKEARLQAFQPNFIRRNTLRETDLTPRPTMVVIGDLPFSEAESASKLCTARNIPVNVVDIPELCTFIFPALIVAGDLTVSVSTGGKAPGAAAYLARYIRQTLPSKTDEILCWLSEIRIVLRKSLPSEAYTKAISCLTARAFEFGRVLLEEESTEIVVEVLNGVLFPEPK